jgi:ribosomal protein S18 acetylase RimI-like enzyme|tara:strand:- start:5202 stop:5696 length:495 start_codon:yes stop_codon:yes gene_type:complete
MSHVKVDELTENDWMRYRDIRIKALESDGHAFGGDLKSECNFSEETWREKARQYLGLVAHLDGKDIGMMTVENLVGDFDVTCWIGSCWVNPEFRKCGALRALFEYVDGRSTEKSWQIQGLGVWVNNEIAITAYEKLGFKKIGEAQESTRKPGKYYQKMIRVAAK